MAWDTNIDVNQLLETAGAALILYQGTRMLYVNQAACEISGYSREELLEMDFWRLMHPDEAAMVRERGRRRQAGEDVPSHYEVRLVTRSGEIRTVATRIRLCEHQGRPAVLVSAVDVTERLQAQAEYRDIFEGAPIGIVRLDPGGALQKANPLARRLLGVEEGARLSSDLLACFLDPGEFECETLPGVYVSVQVRAVQGGFEAFLQDITLRRRLEEKLREAQKLEAVSLLAEGVAHDFNNLLTVISSYGEMLGQRLPDSSAGREMAHQILQAAERARELTHQLLVFGRKQSLHPRPMSLNELVEDFRRLLPPLLGPRVELRLDLCPSGAMVSADSMQLQQALLNLVVNAREAMPDGGTLTISTRHLQDAPPGLAPGPYVELAVADNGVGMEPEVRSRVFEPFFTTRSLGQGTGLGLATVYGIVRQSGGSIEVESTPENGSLFRVLLPAARPSNAEMPSPILLVDDDSAVRTVVRKTLESQGFSVFEASNGDEALELAREQRFGLVVTDVVMPGMDGLELAQRLRAQDPELRFLLISGFRHREDDSLAFLAKPFSPARLMGKVREVLSD